MRLNETVRKWWVFTGFCAALLAGPLHAQQQSAAAEPFAELHGRLKRALDAQLAQAQEAARRSAPEPSAPQLRLEAPVKAAVPRFFVESSAPRWQRTQEKLSALGVNAARIFAEEGVPATLLQVAAVESNFDPLATSSQGARGLWQLMPETALRFGLRVDARIDERTHPARSTRVAARYLRELYRRFGDWPLALAAYNAGEGRVAQTLAATGARSFWTLAERQLLTPETRRYVPAVLGIANDQMSPATAP